jgi:hypothetical protein
VPPGQPPPYGHNPYGQPPPYGHNPYGHDPYGHNPYGPYGHDTYGQSGSAHRIFGVPHPQAPGSYPGQAPYGSSYVQPELYAEGHYPAGPPGYGAPYAYGTDPRQASAWPYRPPSPPHLDPKERRRRTRRRLAFAGVLVLAVGAGIGIGAAIAPTNPATVAQGLFATSVGAAEHAGSFHYVELSTNNGQPDNIEGDASPNGGRQLIKQRGASGTDVFNLRLVHGVVYFRGNEAAVIDQLGVPAARATAVVGRWVKITKGERPYKTFAAGITTKSNLSQLPKTFVPRSSQVMAGSSPPSTRLIGGLSSGKARAPVGTAALVIVTSSSLPKTLSAQAEDATTGARLSLSWTFSHWHEVVHVTAPSGAIAYTSLGASGS